MTIADVESRREKRRGRSEGEEGNGEEDTQRGGGREEKERKQRVAFALLLFPFLSVFSNNSYNLSVSSLPLYGSRSHHAAVFQQRETVQFVGLTRTRTRIQNWSNAFPFLQCSETHLLRDEVPPRLPDCLMLIGKKSLQIRISYQNRELAEKLEFVVTTYRKESRQAAPHVAHLRN